MPWPPHSPRLDISKEDLSMLLRKQGLRRDLWGRGCQQEQRLPGCRSCAKAPRNPGSPGQTGASSVRLCALAARELRERAGETEPLRWRGSRPRREPFPRCTRRRGGTRAGCPPRSFCAARCVRASEPRNNECSWAFRPGTALLFPIFFFVSFNSLVTPAK